MRYRTVNKGSIGCAIGLAIMSMGVAMAAIVLLKCFGIAYGRPDYSLGEYIRAVFTHQAMLMYLVGGLVFSFGLWVAINSAITVLKSFFDL